MSEVAEGKYISIGERRNDVARLIAERGPLTTVQIAEACGCSRNTINRAVNDCSWFEQDDHWKIHLTALGHQVATGKTGQDE